MRVSLVWLVVLILAGPGVATMVAHHSRSAEFDVDAPVSFTGTVVRLDWRNPHVWIFIDAPGAGGTVTHWEGELGSNPVGLARNGWNKNSVKPGDEVVVEGVRSYCCENVMSVSTIRTATGDPLFAGSAPSE